MNHTITKLIILVNLLLLAGQFFMTSKRATDGEKISNLDTQLSVLSQQNSDLENQILKFSSLSYVYTQAEKMQLVPVKVSYLAPLSVASVITINP
jgi:cell division protein FtsL